MDYQMEDTLKWAAIIGSICTGITLTIMGLLWVGHMLLGPHLPLRIVSVTPSWESVNHVQQVWKWTAEVVDADGKLVEMCGAFGQCKPGDIISK